MKANKSKTSKSNSPQVRIIGGQYRSRLLPFVEEAGLRPTGDRIRETLFNWLAPEISGSHCLDLFAGSGALGFEALSRGANKVVFVDRSTKVQKQLLGNIALLNSADTQLSTVDVHCASAANWLGSTNFNSDPDSGFDIVFLDPPFADTGLSEIAALLETELCLKSNALVYIEQAKDSAPLVLPENWQEEKQKISGQVSYRLYRRLA